MTVFVDDRPPEEVLWEGSKGVGWAAEAPIRGHAGRAPRPAPTNDLPRSGVFRWRTLTGTVNRPGCKRYGRQRMDWRDRFRAGQVLGAAIARRNCDAVSCSATGTVMRRHMPGRRYRGASAHRCGHSRARGHRVADGVRSSTSTTRPAASSGTCDVVPFEGGDATDSMPDRGAICRLRREGEHGPSRRPRPASRISTCWRSWMAACAAGRWCAR